MENQERINRIDEKIENFQNIIDYIQTQIDELLNEKISLLMPPNPIWFKYWSVNPKKVKDDFNWLY